MKSLKNFMHAKSNEKKIEKKKCGRKYSELSPTTEVILVCGERS